MLEIYEGTSEHLLVNVSKDDHAIFSIESSTLLPRLHEQSTGTSSSSAHATKVSTEVSGEEGHRQKESAVSPTTLSTRLTEDAAVSRSPVMPITSVTSIDSLAQLNESATSNEKVLRLLIVIYAINSKGRSPKVMLNHVISLTGHAIKSSAGSSPSSLSSGTAQDSPVTVSSSKGKSNHSPSDNNVASNAPAGSQATSSTSNLQSSSSVTTFFTNAAFLPILGVISGLIITLILLGVIFTVMHSIRKQDERVNNNTNDPSVGQSTCNDLSDLTPKKEKCTLNSSCSGSSLSLSKSHKVSKAHHSDNKKGQQHSKSSNKNAHCQNKEFNGDQISAVTMRGSKSSLVSSKSCNKNVDSGGKNNRKCTSSSSSSSACTSVTTSAAVGNIISSSECKSKNKYSTNSCKKKQQQCREHKSPKIHHQEEMVSSDCSISESRSSSSAGFHTRRSQE